MNRLISHVYAGLLARVVLAFVLGYAGIIKLLEPNGAKDAILAYRLGIPANIAQLLGYALPAVEVAVGLLLLVGLFTRQAAAVSAALMALFIVGIAQVWARGYAIDCGCFGGGGDVSYEGRHLRYTIEILRDVFFLLLAIRLYRWPHTGFSLDPDEVKSPVFDDEGK